MQDQAAQRAVRLNPRVDHGRDGVEVFRTQRARRLDDDDTTLFNEAMRKVGRDSSDEPTERFVARGKGAYWARKQSVGSPGTELEFAL